MLPTLLFATPNHLNKFQPIKWQHSYINQLLKSLNFKANKTRHLVVKWPPILNGLQPWNSMHEVYTLDDKCHWFTRLISQFRVRRKNETLKTITSISPRLHFMLVWLEMVDKFCANCYLSTSLDSVANYTALIIHWFCDFSYTLRFYFESRASKINNFQR